MDIEQEILKLHKNFFKKNQKILTDSKMNKNEITLNKISSKFNWPFKVILFLWRKQIAEIIFWQKLYNKFLENNSKYFILLAFPLKVEKFNFSEEAAFKKWTNWLNNNSLSFSINSFLLK